MSDAAVATVVSGAITITGMIVGFLTLWVKAQRAGEKTAAVENKLDETKRTTEATAIKADTIVQQTNGVTVALQASVDQLLGRVADLERYNHDANHRLSDAIGAMHLKVAAMAAIQTGQVPLPMPPPTLKPPEGKQP